MTTFTTIPNAAVAAGGRPRGSLMTALRDNLLAAFEGAANAPRVNSIAAMDHQGVYGAVGTYVFAFRNVAAAGSIGNGVTVAGSTLLPTSAAYKYTSAGSTFGGGSILAGTWRCMGMLSNHAIGSTEQGATLWLRIA